jgi:hypothetical protein
MRFQIFWNQQIHLFGELQIRKISFLVKKDLALFQNHP